MRLPAVLLALALSACATVAQPRAEAPRLRDLPAATEAKEYEIRGESEAELRAQLDRLGPADEGGQRHDAYTHWFVTWRFPFDRQGSTCATGPVTVTLTVSMDLPRWVDAADGPDALKARWQEYLDALVRHEKGHADHGSQAAAEIQAAMPVLPPQPDCEQAERVANDLGHAVLAKFRKEDVAYDAKTDHGATQGARFP